MAGTKWSLTSVYSVMGPSLSFCHPSGFMWPTGSGEPSSRAGRTGGNTASADEGCCWPDAACQCREATVAKTTANETEDCLTNMSTVRPCSP